MERGQIPAEWLPNYTYADYEAWEGDWELIYGIPYAMSPSPKRMHQQIERRCIRILEDALIANDAKCDCEVYHGLDWIINESTIVRPDVMIVCGTFKDDFLHFPPSLVVEITSKRTQIADQYVKFKIYESQCVPYYLIIDPKKKSTEIFALVNNIYQRTETSLFLLAGECRIEPDLEKLCI